VENLYHVIHAFRNEQKHVRNAEEDSKLMIKFKENNHTNPMENNRHRININQGAMTIYENNAPYERNRTYARRISLTRISTMPESSGAAKTPKDKGNQKAKTSVIECNNRTVTQETFEVSSQNETNLLEAYQSRMCGSIDNQTPGKRT
jgi:hypothetical protein